MYETIVIRLSQLVLNHANRILETFLTILMLHARYVLLQASCGGELTFAGLR